MLPKKNRMNRTQFERFGSEASRSVFNRAGTLKFLPKGNLFSVVISSKHCKRAVIRNKTRRRAYAIIRSIMPKFTTPFSGVLYLSKQAHLLPFTEFKMLIEEFLRKADENFE